MDVSCFKAYDLRGRVPDQLNANWQSESDVLMWS